MTQSVSLPGLDGSNPLAFMAALGTLRVLTLSLPRNGVRMHWDIQRGVWCPVLTGLPVECDQDAVVELLARQLAEPDAVRLFEQIGPDLTISGRRLRFLSQSALELGDEDCTDVVTARVPADFLAAFGCDMMTGDGELDSQIEDTAFRTMSGAGHQHFIQFMCDIVRATNGAHLHKALFETWNYDDPGRGLNLRWDPADDRRYALRWRNPSKDPNTTMRGANRLAIESLPLFATAPMRGRLETTSFVQRRRQGVRFTWPIWRVPLQVDIARSLLQSPMLTPPSVSESDAVHAQWRQRLEPLGVAAVFQSQRITTGKFRNFTPARSL